MFYLKKTNSFITGNYVYIIATTNDKFAFTVKDFTTGNLIKEYTISVHDTISFKNTPIIQKGGAYKKYRELEKTQQFLRKISAGIIGVSVYKFNDKYQITLGGIADSMFFIPGSPASFGTSSTFSNPTAFTYNSYSKSKSIYITGLFDSEFNHIKGIIEKNVFDKIQEFKDEVYPKSKGETLFKYKDYYILGNFVSWNKEYSLRRFKD